MSGGRYDVPRSGSRLSRRAFGRKKRNALPLDGNFSDLGDSSPNRSRSQPWRRPASRQHYEVFATGPNPDLNWDERVSPPSTTAAVAIPGYSGHIPGVYAENVISLHSPRANQRAAAILNNLEREKETLRQTERGFAHEFAEADPVAVNQDDDGAYAPDLVDNRPVASLMDCLARGEPPKTPRPAGRRRPFSQPSRARYVGQGGGSRVATPVPTDKYYAVGPDGALSWDGPVSPPSRTANTAITGYSGYMPGVYAQNILGLTTVRAGQKAAAVLNKLERDQEARMWQKMQG